MEINNDIKAMKGAIALKNSGYMVREKICIIIMYNKTLYAILFLNFSQRNITHEHIKPQNVKEMPHKMNMNTIPKAQFGKLYNNMISLGLPPITQLIIPKSKDAPIKNSIYLLFIFFIS